MVPRKGNEAGFGTVMMCSDGKKVVLGGLREIMQVKWRLGRPFIHLHGVLISLGLVSGIKGSVRSVPCVQ